MKRTPLVLRGAIRLKCFIQLPWRTHWLEALFATMQFISMPWVGCWVRETNLVSNQQGRCKQQEFYLGTHSQKLNRNCGSQKVREKWWLTSNLLTTTLQPQNAQGQHAGNSIPATWQTPKRNPSLWIVQPRERKQKPAPSGRPRRFHRFQLVNSRDVLKACGNQAFDGEKSEQIKKSYEVTA